MSDVFGDTSGWGNLIDAGEPYHGLAANLYRLAREERRKIVTTNYVITELVALMTTPLHIPRPKAIEIIEGLGTSPYVQIVHIDPVLAEQAWDLLKSHEDKHWSLVDCASFALMKQLSIQDALTTDHHFEQAGFVRLLK